MQKYSPVLLVAMSLVLSGCAYMDTIGDWLGSSKEVVDQSAHFGVAAGAVCAAIKSGEMSEADAKGLVYDGAVLREKYQAARKGEEPYGRPFNEWCDEGCQRDLEFVEKGTDLGALCEKESN